VNEVERARPKPLPVLLGPPGHESLPPLPPPSPEVDVRKRRARSVPAGVPIAARVVAEALFSRDGSPPDAERLSFIERDFGEFYARAQGNAPLILRVSLLALMYIAPLFVFRPGSLASLSLTKRAHALEKFEASPLAPAALAVKAMLCILWFEHATTQAETNTEPSCMKVRA